MGSSPSKKSKSLKPQTNVSKPDNNKPEKSVSIPNRLNKKDSAGHGKSSYAEEFIKTSKLPNNCIFG